MVLMVLLALFLHPYSVATFIEEIEGQAPEKNEIILKLKIFYDNIVNDDGDYLILFLREKYEPEINNSNFTIINVECNSTDKFVVSKGWLTYSQDGKYVTYFGHFIRATEEIKEKEIHLKIKISGNIYKFFYKPFKFNDVDYPFDRYDVDLLIVIFTKKIGASLPEKIVGERVKDNYEIQNFVFNYKGTYPIKDKNYYGVIYETKDMRITRNLFEKIIMSIFIWILFLLLLN